jgi:hypothetical protein
VASDDYDAMADAGIDRHPDADKFTCPKWSEPGQCICEAELPPQERWRNAGSAWQSVTCQQCGRMYVDEDDYIAIYDKPEATCPPDMIDRWWPPSKADDPPVNHVSLGIAHHHATNHDGIGGDDYECTECGFYVNEDGGVDVGGWVRFRRDENSPAEMSAAGPSPSGTNGPETDAR